MRIRSSPTTRPYYSSVLSGETTTASITIIIIICLRPRPFLLRTASSSHQCSQSPAQHIIMFVNTVSGIASVSQARNLVYRDCLTVACLPDDHSSLLSGFSICPDYPAFLHYGVCAKEEEEDDDNEWPAKQGIPTNTEGWSFVLAIKKNS